MRKVIVGNDKVFIGRLGDDDVREFAFDLSEYVSCMDGEFSVSCLFVLPSKSDSEAYAIAIDHYRLEGSQLIWIPTNAECSEIGWGKFEAILYNDGQQIASLIWRVQVGKSLVGDEEPPEGWENYILAIEKLVDEIEDMTATASVDANVGTPSVVVTTEGGEGEPFSIDFAFHNIKGVKGDKGDTGSKGETGNGIVSIVKTGTSGLVDTYTITYDNGDTDTFTVTNGEKGDTGETPDIYTTAVTLAEGSSAYAHVSGTIEQPLITFGIPKGDGVTSVSVEKTSTEGLVDTYTMTFTYSNGSTDTATFTVTNAIGYSDINSWRTIRQLIRLGLHSTLFKVGDQLTCRRTTAMTASVGTSTGITAVTVDVDEYLDAIGEVNDVDEYVYDGNVWYLNAQTVDPTQMGLTITGTPVSGDTITVTATTEDLVWDIVAFDAETFSDTSIQHSMTLQLHDVWQQRVFDAKEALYWFENGLAAGTYHFLVKANSWVATDVGKYFQFTLTEPIPAGGQIVINGSYNVTFDGTTLSTYASPSDTTAIETVTMSEGSDGTALEDVYNTFGTYTNSCQRARLGNNRYVQSAVRQIINSDSSPYGWEAQNPWDRPSDTTSMGFLYRVDPDFIQTLGKPIETIAKNTVCDGGGSETVEDKIWLASRSQVFGTLENNIDEGAEFPYYEEDTDRRKKTQIGTARYWRLRSPYSGHASTGRLVYTDGSLTSGNVNNSSGLAPACTLI